MSKSSAVRKPERLLVSAIMLFFFSAFLLISLDGEVRLQGIALSVIVPVMIYISTLWLPRFFPADKLLLAIANFLCALGVLILYSTDIAEGTGRGMAQAINYGAGIVAMIVCIMLVRFVKRWGGFIWVLIVFSSLFISLPLIIGKELNGAINWIKIGSLSLQPSEMVKITLIFVLAYFMSKRKFLIWLGFSLFCLLVLMLQRDLGTALIYFVTTLFLYYASTGNLWVTGVGVFGGVGAAVLGYNMFAHVKNRVAIWQNPWLYYETSGYQIAQILMAIASGGLFGVGLGLGTPRVIPVYFTDAIFAVICEQFGIIFGILVLGMYVIMILRGLEIATSSRYSFYGLLAMGATTIIGMQTFVIIGGVLKLIPLTGVTMPFVSYGGTSMVSCMALIGVLQGVNSLNKSDLVYDYQISHSQDENEYLEDGELEYREDMNETATF